MVFEEKCNRNDFYGSTNEVDRVKLDSENKSGFHFVYHIISECVKRFEYYNYVFLEPQMLFAKSTFLRILKTLKYPCGSRKKNYH